MNYKLVLSTGKELDLSIDELKELIEELGEKKEKKEGEYPYLRYPYYPHYVYPYPVYPYYTPNPNYPTVTYIWFSTDSSSVVTHKSN